MPQGNPSQQFIPVQEVRDGVVILKDGGLRKILMASSVNLALKSQQEREATIVQFQSFLNSVEFPFQIMAQSRRLDIKPYIKTLEDIIPKQKEELLRVQTQSYIEFILWFTSRVNIMTKDFFVIVPYDTTITTSSNNPFKELFGGKKNAQTYDPQRFEEGRTQIDQRIAIVQSGLSRIGVRTVELGTQEVIELLYNTFNPGETQRGVVEETQQQ